MAQMKAQMARMPDLPEVDELTLMSYLGPKIKAIFEDILSTKIVRVPDQFLYRIFITGHLIGTSKSPFKTPPAEMSFSVSGHEVEKL